MSRVPILLGLFFWLGRQTINKEKKDSEKEGCYEESKTGQ